MQKETYTARPLPVKHLYTLRIAGCAYRILANHGEMLQLLRLLLRQPKAA